MEEVIENNISDSSSELSINDDYEKTMAIFEDVILPYKEYQELIGKIQNVTNMLNSLKFDKQKEMDKIEKKVVQFLNLYRELNNNYCSFFNQSIVDIRKNIKLEKKKKKENKDKSKYYVNIPKKAPKFILKMMNKNEDDKVSQSQVLTALTALIKKCVTNSPSNYAIFKETGVPDKTKFKIVGELKDFFKNIEQEAELRGNTVHIPEIMGYPNLMSYMQYFVYKENTK